VYIADPFPIEIDGRLHLFYEEYRQRDGRGVIGHAELDANLRMLAPSVVLALDVHASYPQVFEHDGAVHMIPETSAAGEVALYRSDLFPKAWRKVATLVRDIPIVDATVFAHEGRWWLLATRSDEGRNVKLFAWHADQLTGPWFEHRHNPIKVDVHSARPAGRTFVHEGELYRPAQDCARTYGARVVLHRVLELAPDAFAEEAVAHVEPDPQGPYPIGLHTFSSAGPVTFVDGKRWRVSPAAWRRNVNQRLRPHASLHPSGS
jgi:hypothetical protein